MYSAVVRLLQRGNQSPVTSGQETGDHQGGTTGHWALELSTDLREVSQLKAYQRFQRKYGQHRSLGAFSGQCDTSRRFVDSSRHRDTVTFATFIILARRFNQRRTHDLVTWHQGPGRIGKLPRQHLRVTLSSTHLQFTFCLQPAPFNLKLEFTFRVVSQPLNKIVKLVPCPNIPKIAASVAVCVCDVAVQWLEWIPL